MVELNSSRGLGDTIYLRAVVMHLLDRGEQVTVYTPWPAAFADLEVIVKPEPAIPPPGLRSVASSRRAVCNDIDHFSLCCKRAGVDGAKLEMRWTVRNHALLDNLRKRAAGRKIFVYQPRKITNNLDQMLLAPKREAFNRFVGNAKEYFRVKLGHPPPIERDDSAPCDWDLFGKTSIHDAFDIVSIADMVFGEHCFLTILAEAMDKQSVCMFASAARDSGQWVANVTPERMIHKKHLQRGMYDDE